MTGTALAQGVPQATLTGKVVHEGVALPEVVVNVKSAALQGSRTATTSINGDFLIPLLPPGDYTVTFTINGFEPATKEVRLSAAQTTPIQVSMALSGVTAAATVFAEKETISKNQQVATTISSDALSKLPVARTLAAAVNLTPGTTTNGPNSGTVISGAMSFENLFLVNGVVVQDNIRNTPFNLFIEDAIQETTTSTSGISAEYGRFAGGIVNVITKSGGNNFSGSFRTSLTKDTWTSLSAFRDANGKNPENQSDALVPTYEMTLGGPIVRDALWIFAAGRLNNLKTSSNTQAPLSIAFPVTDDEKRYEGKLTWSIGSRHSILANYQQIERTQTNNFFGNIYDTASLYDRELPQKLYSGNYSGTLSDHVFLEAQYSKREFSFVGSGSRFTDIINGTLMVNNANGNRYWSPTFCGVCDDEKRDADQARIKGSYYLSSKGLGSHNLVAGIDYYNDQRFANNHQSGSDYRIYSANIIARNGVVYPQLTSAATGTSPSFIRWTPILQGSAGNNFKTWSAYLNDSWQLNSNLTFNVGVRWDKNDGTDASGAKTANDSKFSPRLAATWDAKGDGDLIVNASYARYVAGIANSIADGAALGGQPALVDFDYRGPAINADPNAANLVTTDKAIEQVFAWFNANGGTGRAVRGNPTIPGVNPNIVGGLDSPNTDEFVIGAAKRLGSRGIIRADVAYRKGGDYYANLVDRTTGTVSGTLAGVTRTFDKQVYINTNAVDRKYYGLTLSASYRPLDRLTLQGNWTYSRLRGNFDGENAGSGPITTNVLQYPEFQNLAFSAPVGDLATDQRHKVRLWAVLDLPPVMQRLTSSFSILQSWDTGTPYGAVGAVDTRPYVTNPGYLAVPASFTYYFTARDAFRTDDIYRTDAALDVRFKLAGGFEVFLAPQVLNVFNSQHIISANVPNGPSVAIETRVNTGTAYAAFNPFTQAPVLGGRNSGANWNYSSNFGQATAPLSYQQPRTFRFSVGLRF